MDEQILYMVGPFVFAILCAISFAFWDWYRKRGRESELQIPPIGDDDFNSESIDNLLSRNDTDNLSGSTDTYNWTQNDKEVEVYISVDESVRGKDVHCTIDPDNLIVMVRGEVLLEGRFYAPVVPDECNWQIDGGDEDRKIWISLFKETPTTRNQHWKCVLEGDREIDTSSLGPPVHRIDVNDKSSMRNALDKVSKYKK